MKGGEANFTAPAELIGHPARSAMLLALLDGRALPMSMLASEAGVAPSTASEHLFKLTRGGLLRVRTEGRRRYFELASPGVAQALEVLSNLAPATPIRSLRDGTRANALRSARTCYDHLAGNLGVAVMRSLLDKQIVTGGDGIHHNSGVRHDRLASVGHDLDYQLTPEGEEFLTRLGIEIPAGKRNLIGYCVDWTEQKHHLGGALGASLLRYFLASQWLEKRLRPARALRVTDQGISQFSEIFAIDTRVFR